MTNTETLIASLTALKPADSFYPNEDEDDARYFDWSTRDDDGNYRFEVGDEDGEALTVNLTPDQLAQLATQITLTLLHAQHQA